MTSILRKTIYIPYKIIFSYQYVKFSSTASLVKSLRERTGAPMMDCKKALQAEGVDNDISKAIEWLRKKGIARANDKSDRKACEGLIAMKILKDYQTLIEINSETDFVARNHEFQSFVTIVANTVANSITSSNKIENITINDLIHQKPAMIDSPTASITSLSSLNSIQEALGETVSKIRETIIIRRALIVSQDTNEQSVSILGNYVHGKVGLSFIPNDIELGRSAAIVKLSVATTSALSNEVNEMLSDIAKKLAMHVVAAKPLYLQASDVPADVVAKETAIFREQSLNTEANLANKPAEVVEKIINGKVNKRLSECCLLQQNHMAQEGSPVVGKYLTDVSKQIGMTIKLDKFYLWSLGSSDVQ